MFEWVSIGGQFIFNCTIIDSSKYSHIERGAVLGQLSAT